MAVFGLKTAFLMRYLDSFNLVSCRVRDGRSLYRDPFEMKFSFKSKKNFVKSFWN